MPWENPRSEEPSENNDDGDRGSGFKLNAGNNNKPQFILDKH